MTTQSTDLLATYLRDHRAAAIAGLRVARRSARANRGGPFGPPLQQLADEIEADVAVLDEVMDVLGVGPSTVKHVGAVAGEFLGRFKLNGRLVGYSPLSRVLEVEGLAGGVEAKAALWVSLAASNASALAAFDFDDLEARAQSQQRRVREIHVRAVEVAFGQERRDSSSGRNSDSQNDTNPS